MGAGVGNSTVGSGAGVGAGAGASATGDGVSATGTGSVTWLAAATRCTGAWCVTVGAFARSGAWRDVVVFGVSTFGSALWPSSSAETTAVERARGASSMLVVLAWSRSRWRSAAIVVG